MLQTVKSWARTFRPRALLANHRIPATKGCSGGDPLSISCPEIELASENTASEPFLQNHDMEKP